MIDSLVDLLHKGNHTLVVANGDDVRTFGRRGVADLFELLTSNPEFLRGASVADKVVGKGAAAMMILGGIGRLHTDIISDAAIELFRDSGVEISYEGDNSFILTTGAPVASYVYLNGEQIEPEYPDAPNYRPVMTNDDVLKVFFGERPESYNVTFDIVESAKGHYTLVHDLIAPVDAAEIKVFEGTEITLTPDVYTTMTVTLDGNPLEKGTDGSYSFTVTSDSILKVTSSESGIDSIGADSDSEAIYYDLTGRRISAPEPGVPAIRVVGGHASKIIR